MYFEGFLRKIKIFVFFKIKKIVIYLALFLFLFTSIGLFFIFFSNKTFINIDKNIVIGKIYDVLSFKKYFANQKSYFTRIKVVNNKHIRSENVIEIIDEILGRMYIRSPKDFEKFINKSVDEIKSRIEWVKNVRIKRVSPDILLIDIEEYEPFALYITESDRYIINNEGKYITKRNIGKYKNLLIISGSDADKNLSDLIKILNNKELKKYKDLKIFSATWVGNRRWDLNLINNILVKLPENNLDNTLNQLIKIYKITKFGNGLKIVDLRVNGKIYLDHDNNFSKEMETFSL